MKQYKGLYVDNAIFNTTQEIERFLEAQAIEAYKTAVKMSNKDMRIESALYADEKAEVLVSQYGYNWEQIEAMEAEIYAAA